MSKRLQSILALVILTAIYGTFSLFARILGTQFALFYQFAVRSAIICLILGIVLYLLHGFKRVSKHDAVWLFWRSLAGVEASAAIFVAFNHLTIGTSYFLMYAGGTVSGFAIGSLFLKEKLNQVKLAALLLSGVGLYFIFTLQLLNQNLGYLILALAAGVGLAGWNVLAKKVKGDYSPLYLTFIDWGLCLPIYLIGSLVLRENWAPLALNIPWATMVIYSFFCITSGSLVIIGFKHLEAQVGSLIMLLEVVFGVIFAFLFFGETISQTTLLGGALILAATALPELVPVKLTRKVKTRPQKEKTV